MIQDLAALTEQVKCIARKAGAFIRQERERFDLSRVEQKGAHDYVSYVDKASERMIVEQLRQLLPQAGFVTEEGTARYDEPEYCWVVDPLDGTGNFIHNMAPFCVSIALRNRHEVLLGVVYECCRDELFWAYKGSAAYLGDCEIHVSRQAVLDQSFVELGFPYAAHKFHDFILAVIADLYGHVGMLRLIGAAAAELCYVAAGRAEARIEGFIGAWDIAAASIILRQAGGKLTDFSGSDDCLDAKEVFASNGLVHQQLLDVMARHKNLLQE